MDAEALLDLSGVEKLVKDQHHPDAIDTVGSTLSSTTRSQKLWVVLKELPFLLVVIVSLLLVQLPLLVYLMILMPTYCMCRSCALRLAGIEEVCTHEPECLLPAEVPNGIPAKLQGVIYMRGNPFVDDLMTFEKIDWNPTSCTATLHVYGSRRFTFQNSFLSLAVCLGARFICYRYEFQFDSDLKHCSIYPKILCFTIPPEVWSLHMTDVSRNQDGSLWERWTTKLGTPIPSYWAEKVVDGKRQRTPYYEHVTSEVNKLCYVNA